VAVAAIKRYWNYAFIALGAALWVATLLLLAKTVQNSAQFGRFHPWILLINAVGVVVLLLLLAVKLAQLIGDYRRHVIGSRLKARTVGIFGALVVAPLLIVYYFSLQFLDLGIDSWFNSEVKEKLNEALTLSRTVLDGNRREDLQRAETLAHELMRTPENEMLNLLAAERRNGGASEVTLIGQNGRIIAASSDRPLQSTPQRLAEEIMMQVGQGLAYVSLEPMSSGAGYLVRTAVPLPAGIEPRVLVADYPVSLRLAELVDAVQHAHAQYGELSYLRGPLKESFRLTLTLVLLLSLLAAVYGAFFSAQRLVKPIQDLAAGTRAVGKGDFDTRLPLSSRDEMGFLVHSFNDMTKRLARAREEAQRSQRALLQAQRDAAWGEVARRLAHEIKNPLTPIQLSAERIRRRFLSSMSLEDAQVLDRATHTIVQQVEAMKQMVNAFSEYARAPEMNLAPFELNPLIMEVAELYRTQDSQVQLKLDLDPAVGEIEADRDRVRQILNNLVTNSIEAFAMGASTKESRAKEGATLEARITAPPAGKGDAVIEIKTQLTTLAGIPMAEVTVRDNGAGFDPQLLGQVFDPYVTSKPKGTGLGLAIVKKIVEEHGGRIEADNRRNGGARVRVLLPLQGPQKSLGTVPDSMSI
jgi:nitrogen fixation/metabolism regulation signal transduction histidine kinase